MARVGFGIGHLRFYVVLNISMYLLFNLIKAETDESNSEEIQLEIINNKGSYPNTSQPPPLGESIST